MSAGQVVSGPQDPVLRHGPFLVLRDVRVRQQRLPYCRILQQGKGKQVGVEIKVITLSIQYRI